MKIAVPCFDCGAVATKRSRCDACRSKHEKVHRERYRPYGRPWRRMRDKVLAVEKVCRCGQPTEHVDHRVPKALGGSDDRSNLEGTCAHCNLTKGARV